jgi:predicted nucleic acid-binding protein
MAYILDTGFLYAALEDGEPQHEAVINITGGIREPIIFPVPAITEVFVDAIIVAIAERLNITRVLTLDVRDFRMFSPRHCAAFELLP